MPWARYAIATTPWSRTKIRSIFASGSPEPYGKTVNEVDAQSAYLSDSHEVSDDLRAIIIEMMDVAMLFPFGSETRP